MAYIGTITGSCTGSNSGKYSCWIDWIVNKQNDEKNKSNVTITYKTQRNDGVAQSAYNLNKVNPVTLSVGGIVRVSEKIGIDTRNNKIVTLATWTGDVSHDEDGTLSLNISGSFSMSGTGVSTLTGGSASGVADINPISRYPGGVTVCTAAQDGDTVNYNRGTVTIAWSGASGSISSYKVERAETSAVNGAFAAWHTIAEIPSNATSGSITDIAPSEYMSGVKFKYRVTALNGQLAAAAKESNALTVRGGLKLRVNSTWFNGTVWVKVNGIWQAAKRVAAKANENWRESIC